MFKILMESNTLKGSPLPRKPAFTLVELLVSIAIIVTIIALLFPAFAKIKEGGFMGKCTSNQRQALVGIVAYCGEHSGQLPMAVNLQNGETWEGAIAPYLDGIASVGKTKMRCPSSKLTDVETYGVNYGENSDKRVFGVGPVGYNGAQESKRLSQISGKSILIADISDKGGGPGSFCSPWVWPFNSDQSKDGVMDSFGAFVGGRGPYNFVAFRHSGSTAIAGFADGSVRRFTIKQWQTNDDGMWGP